MNESQNTKQQSLSFLNDTFCQFPRIEKQKLFQFE